MSKLYYVTSNTGKLGNINRILAEHGFEVVQLLPHDMPEIQADTSFEVAREKVRWAFKNHWWPVLVNDTAFHVPALGGFPGPTLKYATATLGYEGFRRLIEPLPEGERGGYFEDTVAYLDTRLVAPKAFTRRIMGRVLPEPRGDHQPHPSFFMSRLFVPDGWDKTVAEMTAEEFARYRHSTSLASTYHEFGTWLEGHSRP